MNKELLKKYLDITEQIEKLQAEKDTLNTAIKAMLQNEPDRRCEDDELVASMCDVVTYKVKDETAVISYIKQSGLKNNFIVEKLDTTKFNKELKAKGILYDNLCTYIDENVTQKLTVRRK